MELAAARSVLREIIALAEQASGLTDEQLRFRLRALAECTRSESYVAHRSPADHWSSEAPTQLLAVSRSHRRHRAGHAAQWISICTCSPQRRLRLHAGGHGRAACGRLIAADGLTLAGPSAGMCLRPVLRPARSSIRTTSHAWCRFQVEHGLRASVVSDLVL